MPLTLRPKKEITLLLFLKEELSDWRPRTVKERLQRQCIRVNGQVVTHHLFMLHENDEVEVSKSHFVLTELSGGIGILHQDESLIGTYKPAGMLSVGTEKVRDNHALAIVREALGDRERLWPVHRLDRESSGVLLFARSRAICDALQSKWKQVEKIYLAVVEGHPSPPEGVIDQPLFEDKSLMVRVRSNPAAKDARTRYRTRKTGPTRSLVEIQLETGRRHQIRAHMAWLGNPVVGDPRYGQKASRLALHAQQLSFEHPVTNRHVLLKAKTPAVFSKFLSRTSVPRTAHNKRK